MTRARDLSNLIGSGNVAGDTMTSNLSFSDNDKAIFGASNDLQIYHDGSNNRIVDSGTGSLYIQGQQAIILANADASEFYATFDVNGAATLRYDNAQKLATTSTGVDVTGTATVGTITVSSVYPRINLTDTNNDSDWSIINDNGNITFYDVTNASHAFRINDDSSIVVPAGDLDVGGTTTSNQYLLDNIAKDISDTAVDVFVYDTSKDSDGGAWRKRTQNTSWYNETLNTSTRGSRKEFPAVAVIVLESSTNDMTIYDGDDPDLPMWMVMNDYPSIYSSATNTSVTAMNGMLVQGNGGSSGGLGITEFIQDRSYIRITNASAYWLQNVAGRNAGTSGPVVPIFSAGIVNRAVNDVAMTVLPNAPLDAATGLPVPTIAVATDGGVSVIKDDGTVVDITFSSFGLCSYVSFTDEQKISFTTDDTSANQRFLKVYAIPNADVSEGLGYDDNTALESYDIRSAGTGVDLSLFKSSTFGGTAQGRGIVGRKIASTSGVGIIDPNTEQPSRGMVSLITSDYNTGWMNGDIKLATLSDTDDTDVTGSELVTNGTFDSDLTGWTVGGTGATATVVSGQAVLTRNGTSAKIFQNITTEVGKTYTITVDFVGATGGAYFYGFFSGGSVVTAVTNTTGTYTLTGVAGSTSEYFQVNIYNTSSGTITIDNVSIREAEEDRSVNGNGLQVFGTVTKNPVATGADLVAYGPFTSTNYLKQPPNAVMAFGTGDFCFMGWAKTSDVATTQFICQLDGGSTASSLSFLLLSSGVFRLSCRNATDYAIDSKPAVANVYNHVVGIRRNGTLEMYVNGEYSYSGLVTSITNNTINFTEDGTSLFVGNREALSGPWKGSLALLRVSATAPTAEQIAKIYEDEKVLFQEGAQATLHGSSDAVTALAYDDATELLHAGTSAGRSVFQGLRRVENTTNAVGAAISASNGLVAED